MQEKFEKNITTEWVALSDLITIEANATYRIQNRGTDVLVALEADSLPGAGQDGDLILPFVQAPYKKGTQNLYLRAFSNICGINITKVG